MSLCGILQQLHSPLLQVSFQSTKKKIYAWLSEAAQQQNRMSSDSSNNADKALELVKKPFSKETKIHLQTILGKCQVIVLENNQWLPSLRNWWRVSPHIGKHKTTRGLILHTDLIPIHTQSGDG